MKSLKIVIPIVTLLIAGVLAWVLVTSRPEVATKKVEHKLPMVDIVYVQTELRHLNVTTQGVVLPRTEIQLVPEVPGKITKIHPAFAAGGFFNKNELLLMIDPRDYDFAVTKMQALVAEARRELLREQAEAEQAQREWQALGGGKASDFVLRKPHLEERRAKLAAAEAELAEARLKRTRCEIRAPFSGRIRKKNADIGQYVAVGESLAVIFATDVVEIRLPLNSEQLNYIDLPNQYRNGQTASYPPNVKLTARLSGKIQEWTGQIVRTEGALDDKTGVFYAVAQVKDPYGFQTDRLPLSVGLFVQAEIEGRASNDLVVLPASALVRGAEQVLIVDKQGHVHFRRINILRIEGERVLIASGLTSGEQVIVSSLETPVEGMTVQIATQTSQLNPPSQHGHEP